MFTRPRKKYRILWIILTRHTSSWACEVCIKLQKYGTHFAYTISMCKNRETIRIPNMDKERLSPMHAARAASHDSPNIFMYMYIIYCIYRVADVKFTTQITTVQKKTYTSLVFLILNNIRTQCDMIDGKRFVSSNRVQEPRNPNMGLVLRAVGNAPQKRLRESVSIMSGNTMVCNMYATFCRSAVEERCLFVSLCAFAFARNYSAVTWQLNYC